MANVLAYRWAAAHPSPRGFGPSRDTLHERVFMASFRSFISTYSPLFILGAAILGLYVMAICIGFGLNVHV
jgi:hypothetical protein